MFRITASTIALLGFQHFACAQGTWPDDPWTDFRTIEANELSRDGRAVAFAFTTIVASGYTPGNNEDFVGAFATFVRGDRRYERRQFFTDPADTPSPGFGMRLAASGTYIAVADPGYSSGYEQVPLSSFTLQPDHPGRVEIYRRSGPSSDFSHSHTLENPTGSDASGFGLSLSFASDYLLVGAPFATVFGVPEAGAAFLYRYRSNPPGFTRVATFLPPSPTPYSNFGWSVAASRNDGVYIGWPNFDNGEGRVAYFTEESSVDWKLARIFSPNDLELPDDVAVKQFGASIATMADEVEILAIGAPGTNSYEGSDVPRVFIYEADSFLGEPWTLTGVINQPTTFPGTRFGESVSFNSDHVFRRLAVGSGNRDSGGGVVNVYSNFFGDDGWLHAAQLLNANGGSIAMFPYNSSPRLVASGNDGNRAILFSEVAVCFPDLRADANNDGVTNFEDLNLVLSQFGQQGDDLEGDLNGDGVVEFFDLNVVLVLFGSPCIPPN